MAFDQWALFMAIWVAASIPLGPNALNCVSCSAAYGLRSGLWSVVGVTAAAIIHMTLTLTGLATFMSANPFLFDIIRWLGVCYLAWMGFTMFRSTGKFEIERLTEKPSAGRLVSKAVLISLSNPKAIFAWLAVFSQFVRPNEPLWGQLLVLAPSALSVTLLVYGAYTALGLGVRRVFAGQRRRWFDRITGSTYLAFAFGLAATDLRRT